MADLPPLSETELGTYVASAEADTGSPTLKNEDSQSESTSDREARKELSKRLSEEKGGVRKARRGKRGIPKNKKTPSSTPGVDILEGPTPAPPLESTTATRRQDRRRERKQAMRETFAPTGNVPVQGSSSSAWPANQNHNVPNTTLHAGQPINSRPGAPLYFEFTAENRAAQTAAALWFRDHGERQGPTQERQFTRQPNILGSGNIWGPP